MSRVEIEILKDLKAYLGCDYTDEQESILLFCTRRAIRSFRNKRNYPDGYTDEMVEKDMEKFYVCVFDLALYWMTMQGVEFHDSFSGNGESRSFKSEDQIYAMHNVVPIAVLC